MSKKAFFEKYLSKIISNIPKIKNKAELFCSIAKYKIKIEVSKCQNIRKIVLH